MNEFLKELEKGGVRKLTENGASTYSSTLNAVLDLFALGGAYRSRSEAEVFKLFGDAMAEDKVLATQCLFYLRDVRGGQGERRLFRTALPLLLNKLYMEKQYKAMYSLVSLVAEYGRWDDLLSMFSYSREVIRHQFLMDIANLKTGEGPVSLLGKWMPSVDASSPKTVKLAKEICAFLGMRQQVYRKHLSALRKKLAVVECKMSANDWDSIVYEHVPSQAMLHYKNAFVKHDAKRFAEYLASVDKGEKKINAGTLYPHQLVAQVNNGDAVDTLWRNLPNYIPEGRKMIAVADVSESMNKGENPLPMDVSIALALYTAEHNTGAFANMYMTFSSQPRFIKVNPNSTLSEKVWKARSTGVGYDTNINAVFDSFLRASLNVREEDLPNTILIISDMEFNDIGGGRTNFEVIKQRYASAGVKMPTLVFWNVAARNNTIPVTQDEDGCVLVSGFSPVILRQVFDGKTPMEFMLETLGAKRYQAVADCFK